jgi:ABC-2 type transport system ATP-binding protein
MAAVWLDLPRFAPVNEGGAQGWGLPFAAYVPIGPVEGGGGGFVRRDATDPSPPGADVVLRCESLVRRFGDRTAVDGISFEIGRGETFGLLGPNGAGKTTTISIVSGVLSAHGGRVSVCGREMGPGAGAVKLAVGLVPQDIALYPELTARENLRFFGRLQGMGRRELRTRIDDVLAVVGLEPRGDDRIDSYSGGMKRRVNIAVGLLHEPALLVLDEPTVGVDPQSRNQILDSIEQLRSGGLSVLYTTHYMEEAERLCDRIAIMDHGRLLAVGTRAELLTMASAGLDANANANANADADADVVVDVDVRAASDESPSTGGRRREDDLESVFLRLTGDGLRDR